MRIGTILILGGALALAACDRSEPEAPPVENNVVEAPVAPEPVNNIVEAAPVNVINAEEPAAPPPDFSDQEQMLDDADATGLTSRLPDQSGEPANETAPVQ